MISHYHRLVAIHLVTLLILRVSPSPTPSVTNVNLDLGSTHHTVAQNADCDKPVGNPFDILPSISMELTGNDNANVGSKPLALFGDEDLQIESEIKDTYDIGSYSAVCWSRIVTTIEDENGRLVNNYTEYAISFETPGDIPDKYLAQYSIEEHNNKYVKKSVQVPIVNERKSGDNTVREKRYITCSSGPFYSRTLIKYKNNKKKLEIRVSPESHKNDDTENKSLIDDICEDPEDDEKTVAIKEELLWQIIRDILGKNGQNDISGKNLTELINEKRTELIAKIEEIMPDNSNKTDSILDETVEKIKRDEMKSSITTSLTGGSKIESSQWGTSTNSENTESTEEFDDATFINESTQSSNTFTIKVTEFVTHRRGVILDEIMRHMKVSCYDISKHILETACPAQLDNEPTIDSAKLPSSVSYTYKRDIPASVKQNSFLVTDPLRKVCYHLVTVRKVECPADTDNLLNLRIVTYEAYSQATTTEIPSYMTVFPAQGERTFTIKTNEIVSHRRGVILDEIMRHQKISCYDISEHILETACPAQLDVVPTMDSTKLPSSVSYTYKRDISESVKQNSFLVTDPLRKACYYLVKVKKVECPLDTSNLLNLRIVTYAANRTELINEKKAELLDATVEKIKPDEMKSSIATSLTGGSVIESSRWKTSTNSENVESYNTFTIRVTEFVTHRRGVILDEIMRHMKVSCYDISEHILETACPAQLDVVPTIDSTQLPSSVSYTYKRDIPESVKQNSFLVTDPLRKACYYLVKVRKVECPSDTDNLLNLRIVTYEANSQATITEIPSYMTVLPVQEERTFTIKVTEFVSHRRGAILDEIMRHLKGSCYDISEHILETACPAQLDVVPTMDSTKLPSSVSYTYKRDISESVKQNSFLVTDPLRKACYYLVKVRKVECPADTDNLLNLRIVTYEAYSQATTTEIPSYMTVFPAQGERTFTIKVTEFVSQRRGVILDEIMRHMKVSCYDISEHILETACPAQLDVVPTMDRTQLPSSVSYTYKRDISESVKQNSFLVTDPLRKACYYLVKVKKVECPLDTSNLLNLRIVTYAANRTELINEKKAELLDATLQKIKPDEMKSSITTSPTGGSVIESSRWKTSTNSENVESYNTFTIRVTEFVTHRRGVILDEIMRNMKVSCYDVSENILESACPAQLDVVPTMDSTQLPSSVSYTYKRDIPESVKQNSFLVTDPLRKACYYLVKVRKVECPADTDNLLNLRIVTYAGNSQTVSTATTKSNSMMSLKTFIVRITEFMNRRSVILNGILQHMEVHCYQVLKTILQVPCKDNPEYIAELDTATFPTDVDIKSTHYVSDLTDSNHLYVTSIRHDVCYVLRLVDKIPCPTHSTNLVNIRVVDLSRFLTRTSTNDGKIDAHSYNEATHSQNHAVIHAHTDSNINKKYQTERKIQEKLFKKELMDELIEDIESGKSGHDLGDLEIKKELLKEVVEDIAKEKLEPEWYFTKYVDSNNIVYCFKENADSLNRTTCPEDTANLELVSFTGRKSFLARYIDNEGRTHCVHVYNHMLKPTSCSGDVMNLPVVQPTNERPLLVKFMDKQKNVHCYLQYPNRLEHMSCSNDHSILPEISMQHQTYLAQYIDFYKNRFCFEVHDDFIKKVSCPSETLPSLYLSNEQSFIGKVEIGNGIDVCYIVYPNYWKPTTCPDDTSNVPVIFSSTSQLYIGKITDNANEDFCYFVYEKSLKPAPCPLDTTNLPSIDLSNGKSYTGKIVDAKNTEYCFTVLEDSMVPVACPEDTSRLPYITLDNNLGYTGKMETAENGIQCFFVSKSTMKTVTCPEELSTIPYVSSNNQMGYLAKYVDFMGQTKCVNVYKNTMEKSICPADTSKLLFVSMPNTVDKEIKKDHIKKKIETKVIKKELKDEIIEDIESGKSGHDLGELGIKKELLEEVVEDIVKEKLEPEWYFTKYVDSNDIVYCFKENADSLNRTTCPEDTAILQFVSLTQGKSVLARYIDNEGRTHCVHVYNHILKPTSCSSDVTNLPVVQPTNERPLLVKFMDKQKNVHCYLQYPNRLEHISCSNDHSIFPEISMQHQTYLAQYVDFYKNRFCFEVHDDFVKKVSCPSETLPSLYLSNEQSFIGKVEIGNGIEFCYIVYSNYWKPTTCPDDTSNVPVIFSSTSQLYIGKITDNANEDFCYFVYEKSLKPAPCPLDTSNLPSIDLSNGKSYTGKIVDAKNTEYCFTVLEDSMVPVACPEDTSRLPYITLDNNLGYTGKMETAENGIQCFFVSKSTMKTVTCPEELSTIPYVSSTDKMGYLAKYVDFMGQTKCLFVYKNTMEKSICPADTSKLLFVTMPNTVDKEIKKDYIKKKIETKAIKKELKDEIIEDIESGKSGLELDDLGIKKELLEEVVEDIVKEELEPEWYFTKYVDSNNIVYCFKENAVSLNRTTCPEDTAILQFVSLTQGKSFLARYVDNTGRTHCVHVYNHILKPTSCSSDVTNLPVVQPTNEMPLLAKFMDKQKNVQCYLQYPNRLEHTSCSNDHSTLHQHDEMGYLAKYVDFLGQTKCFIVYNNFMQNTVCPVDTSLLPIAPTSTNVEWYGKYVTAQGDTICLKIEGDTRTPVPCPDDADMLPTVENIPPHSVTLHRKEIRELIKVMCKGKFYSHFEKNNNSLALQKIRQFLP